MSTYLNETRQRHIDIEQAVKCAVYEFQNKAKTHKATLYQNHRINHHLTSIQSHSQELLRLYDEEPVDQQQQQQQQPHQEEQEESYRDRELKSLTGATLQDTINQFNNQVQSLLEYHSKFNIDASSSSSSSSSSATSVMSDEFLSSSSSTNDLQTVLPVGKSTGNAILDQMARQEIELERCSRQVQEKIVEKHVRFTGEEHYGRFVDLNALYLTFINLPMNMQMTKSTTATTVGTAAGTEATAAATTTMDYLTYLSQLSHFRTMFTLEQKCNEPYLSYLKQLYDYLEQFYRKTQPLSDLDRDLNRALNEFERDWIRGDVPGYESVSGTIQQTTGSTTAVGAGANASRGGESREDEEDNEEEEDGDNDNGGSRSDKAKNKSSLQLSEKRIKSEQTSVSEPTADTSTGATNQKKQKKKRRPRRARGGKSKKLRLELLKDIAKYETLCSVLLALLSDVIESTMIQLEKKQVRTWEEIQNDLAREELMEERLGQMDTQRRKEGADDEDSIGSSNPLNLPLGWDGKPIPFWLYKLYGLNQEFKCEICGDFSYWGPRAFEKHFQEWRHANGMRCLRIPNTRHFHQITKIADAKALWEKIKKEEGSHVWRSDDMEEFEDEEGNVFNKKTYLDLKRQRLIN